jgi:hypothetical protein
MRTESPDAGADFFFPIESCLRKESALPMGKPLGGDVCVRVVFAAGMMITVSILGGLRPCACACLPADKEEIIKIIMRVNIFKTAVKESSTKAMKERVHGLFLKKMLVN